MFKWAQQTLANVAGTQEPIYGPDAIQSVEVQAKDTPYTELTKDDLKWVGMQSTCVETQTFYLMADSGLVSVVQIIYSNVAGITTTCQFNTKIFYRDGKTPNLWASDQLSGVAISDDKFDFTATGCSFVLSEDGASYKIKSTTNKMSVVDLKISRIAPGFVIGKNGSTFYGTDPAKPWGSMRHAFWPRCKVEGSIMTQAGELDFTGRGFFSHALQGMKPHHAAARWNFVNFQSPTYSAIMMEFTTPPSYASTVVNIGGIATDGAILFAGASNSAKHTEIKGDADADWPEPGAVEYSWGGKTKDGKEATAIITSSLDERMDRVDVMAEVPKFVKQIVAGAAGTRPYIYQYGQKMTLKLKIGDVESEEEGLVFMETTFIS